MNVLSKNWSDEIVVRDKRFVPNRNKYSHITCDISRNDFNQQFADLGNKMNS